MNHTSQLSRRTFIKSTSIGSIGVAFTGLPLKASSGGYQESSIGIIGMDTSHSVAFTKYINSGNNGFKVTAAYTTVSRDIPSSYQRVEGFTTELEAMGIEIHQSIEPVLESCDCILLETNDGRLHLEQARKVFESGKRVFIDKPVAADFQDVKEIYRLATEMNQPVFSSSGTRYLSKAQKVRNGSIGKVLGADTFSPVNYEPSHSELFWYGIHGVELLYTVMGAGCQRVRRFISEKYDTVLGEWEDGRTGTFRGILDGQNGYGGQAFGSEGITELGPWEGYDGLIEAILEYFRTGKSPVTPEETLEIYNFMHAAVISKSRDGQWVSLNSTQ